MQKLKFVSLNVRGLREFKKRKKNFAWAKNKKPNVIFLQETHSAPENEKFWSTQISGDCIYSHGQKNSRGVMTIVRIVISLCHQQYQKM